MEENLNLQAIGVLAQKDAILSIASNYRRLVYVALDASDVAFFRQLPVQTYSEGKKPFRYVDWEGTWVIIPDTGIAAGTHFIVQEVKSGEKAGRRYASIR